MARPPLHSIAVDTPQRILTAAESAFATHGFSDARLSDIADGAGLRRPSLLYHFPSKELLYAAVVRASFARLGSALWSSRAGPEGFVAQLAAVARAFEAFVEAEPLTARLVVREMLAPAGPGQLLLLEQVAPLLDEVTSWIVVTGAPFIRPKLPVRAALLHITSDALLRCASGPLRVPIWGPPLDDTCWQIARVLLLSEEAA